MERKLWCEFQRTKKDGTVLKFSVIDCIKDRFGDFMDMYKTYFIRDSPLLRLAGISNSEDAKEEFSVLLTKMLKEEGIHISICIENTTGLLVGVSTMKLLLNEKKTLPKISAQTKEVAKLLELSCGIWQLCDVPSKYSVDKYYRGRGMIVHPDYRGIGIGSILVELKKKICKEHGVPLFAANMSSIGTQKACDRDGWETAYEIDSDEFCRKFDVTPFDGIAPTFKVMVSKV